MITRDALETAMVNGRAFIHPSEIEPFCRHAARAYTLIEIGTGFGACACLMLLSAPARARVHSIDPFLPDTFGTWRATAAQARQHVQNAAQALGFDATRWTLHEGLSHEVAQEARASGLRADLVFVDGDHTCPAVRQDIEDWLPLLRHGGALLLHDSRRLPDMPAQEFHRGWPGPTQVADELRGDPRVVLVEEAHSFTIWRKV
jgi:predicted O-methyltransferase YrrM